MNQHTYQVDHIAALDVHDDIGAGVHIVFFAYATLCEVIHVSDQVKAYTQVLCRLQERTGLGLAAELLPYGFFKTKQIFPRIYVEVHESNSGC